MQVLGENRGLSDKARANLERNEQIRKQSEQSRWIKMGTKDPATMVLLFDAEKIQYKEGEYNGRPTKQFEYTVSDPNDVFGVERILSLSKTWSEKVDALLMAGEGARRVLTVRRTGTGKNDTKYEFEPA